MEQDIQNILQLVRSHAKSHKLKALKNFILRKYNQEEVLDSLEALEEYLRNRCDFEEETINEIYKILSQNFTNGSPYFVMEI
ncbi:hypothetical protein [Paenibacillus sp. WLX2291]|uniref:hypothetical protein n=1 Tax=Paenibacillus sp. WLX2291 TaxID=3296934 RepID=UPI0039843EAD